MKCPTCQADMAQGYLYCGGSKIDWVRQAQPGWKKFLLVGNQGLTDFHGKLPGLHCGRCGIVVIAQDKLKEP